MKQFLLLFIFFVLLGSSCRKNKPNNPLEELPPETQTGANTFGCLVNGQVFKPGGSGLSGPNLAAIYQYLYSGSPTGYVFAVNATDKKDPCNITQIGFRFDSVSMNPGTYMLKTMQKGRGGAGYQLLKCSYPLKELLTNNQTGGELIYNIKDFNAAKCAANRWA
jgi:hypothetical protein